MNFGTLSFARLGSSQRDGAAAPVLNLSAASVLESTLAGSTVGVLSVSGGSGTYTFTKTADPDSKFTLSGSNLNTAAGFDFEVAQSHWVTISASNGVSAPIVRAFQIAVENVFEAPSLSALTGTFSLAENATAGAVAGAIGAKTSGSTLSLVSDAGGRVALSGANIVRGVTSLDYEVATSHSFTVRETLADSANSPRDTVFTLNVTDIDEVAPTITSANPSGFYAEGAPVSGTLTANETVTWSKSGTDAALVTLNTSTGAWSITSTTDFETKSSYSWAFIATDSAGNSSSQTVAITITDVAESLPSMLVRESDGTVTVTNLGPTWSPNLNREPDGTVTVGA